ncbi:MAG: thioredoxin domain-containing protein [Chloroflexota bacterium]|nr:thioredoxin domain-containing protein [Chloroflexota bacterium]
MRIDSAMRACQRYAPTLLLFVLLVGVAAVAAQTPDRYIDLPQSTTDAGFPRIGFPSAPVGVTLYLSFDDPASINWVADTFDTLYNRLRTGEIRLTTIPLTERGALPGGVAAARAALCASEQGAFWRFFDALYGDLAARGGAALEGVNLIDTVTTLALDRGRWDACMASQRPDVILRDGERAISELNFFTGTPYVLINGDPTLTDATSIEAIIQAEIDELEQAFEQAIDATPESTREGLTVVEPLTGEQIAPPIALTLPDGWGYAYDALILQDIDGLRSIPFAVYQGAVTDGTGTIVLLWGFPSLVSVDPLTGNTDAGAPPSVWTDALRLLRLAIIEQGCNVGTDLRREYSIGGLAATGTQFSAVDCPELPDARGWFAGLQQVNLNFVFYAFTTPIEALDGAAADELQAVLDSVTFQPLSTIEITPTAPLPPPPPTPFG